MDEELLQDLNATADTLQRVADCEGQAWYALSF